MPRILSTFQPEYFPTLDYFWKIAQCNTVILTDHFQYSKRKPFSISAPINNSNTVMTIPVSHDKKLNPISKKTISYNHDWPAQHYSTIKHQFHRQPFAYLYLPEIKKILYRDQHSLSTFLTEQIKLIINWLNLDVKIFQASELGFSENNNVCIINWCHLLKCKFYINTSFIYENNFVDKSVLNEHNVSYKYFFELPSVSIFNFYKSKSILSFLFQFGPEAGYLIKQFLQSS